MTDFQNHHAPRPDPIDLRLMAKRVMTDAGFATDFPSAVEQEMHRLSEANSPHLSAGEGAVRDLRSLLWSSIDNPESRDLDQLEFVRREADGSGAAAIRLLVAVADVDAFVPRGSATDRTAYQNTTSVYTGVETFPMLPERLSTDLTSLVEGEDRLAVVIDLLITESGEVRSRTAYRALVRNQARLNYDSVGVWLEGRAAADAAAIPPEISSIPGLEAQLRLQDELTQRLRTLRLRSGALEFETIEARTIATNGHVTALTVPPRNRAQYLIESIMVAVNDEVADLLGSDYGFATIQRVVRTPARWGRIVDIAAALGETLPPEADSGALAAFLAKRRAADPLHFPDLSLSVVKLMGAGEYVVVRRGATQEGHFALAVQGYSHSTAPNRRYPDLITQRLLKAAIAKGNASSAAPPPYTEEELTVIAAHCNERSTAARKVERRMRKAAAAVLLRDRIGETFNALVTGASSKGTFVRLLDPPAEGRVMRGEQGLDVGDSLRVRLLAANPETGFIDFAALSR